MAKNIHLASCLRSFPSKESTRQPPRLATGFAVGGVSEIAGIVIASDVIKSRLLIVFFILSPIVLRWVSSVLMGIIPF